MWQFIANLILRNRLIIIGLLTLFTVFLAYNALTGLKLDNRYGVLLPETAQASIDYERFQDMFGEDGGVLVIGIQTDSLYTEDRFRKWKELGDSILTLDGVESVVSEANLFTIYNNREKGKFDAHRVFSDVTYKEKSIDSIQSEIRNNPMYKDLLFNDKNASLMMVEIDGRFLLDQEKANVVLDIEALAASYVDDLGHAKFAGLPHLRVIIGKRVVREMYVFVGLLILVTSLLLYLFFRSLRVVFICNLVVVVAVIWSIGLIGALGFDLTIIMALIPPLMIVIGIPNCIFLITKYHQEVKEHGNKVKALTRVIRKIGTATFLTNLTTSLGFLTFISTNSPKLIEFGISASLNIILVFVLSICILPIVLSFSKKPREKHLKHLDRKLAIGLLNNLVYIAGNHRRWVYIVTIGLVVFSIAGMTRIEATGNLTGDLPEGDQILKDVQFIQENFGGSIPFEIMIDYKENSRLQKRHTLIAIDSIQRRYSEDTLFTRFVSYIDVLKAANMAYNDNDVNEFRLITSKRKLSVLKNYIDSSIVTNSNGGGMALNEFIDTANRVLRIRSQMMDIGSYQVSDIVDSMEQEMDEILNPDRKQIERLYELATVEKKKGYYDSIVFEFPAIYNALTDIVSKGDEDEIAKFDLNPELIKKEFGKNGFDEDLRAAIDNEYFKITITGASRVASEGTKYLVINLLTSLVFAILAIAVLMSILFRSWRMVMVSLIPNFIPLLFTAGIMGWFGIPLKPSTLLVFSIAFGISVDDTIHYLAKYRLELKSKQWDLKECVMMAIREAGLGMFYTSIVLFCGFSMFSFSQFGGTQALGLLVSLTLLIAMITNLVLLPSLLLSLEHRLTTKSFEEPFFDAYTEESDLDWEDIDVHPNPFDGPGSKTS
ncbi:MAG: MMPL family transporter [Crocinitomicaceae bacterium]|nr:MMPL family transporter [Flavobacteriales bacterium]NQZ38310.1 MMPL family transporter [Crocinitomicaceae bacterium]